MRDVIKRLAIAAFLLLSLAYLGHVLGSYRPVTVDSVGPSIPAEAVGGNWRVYR